MDAWGLSGGRPVTVAADETLTIRLPHKLVAAIDSYARALEMTRSKAIRMLLERSAASPNRRTRLKQRDRRIAELKRDLDKANALVEEMREQVQDGFDLIASWIEAFGMKLADDGKWYYDDWVESCIKFPRQIHSPPQGLEQVRSRLQRHRGPAPRNDLPALRNCNTVWRCASLAASGRPTLRIAEKTSLGLNTISTFIDKDAGTDRTTRRHIERVYRDMAARKAVGQPERGHTVSLSLPAAVATPQTAFAHPS
jgi:hypothetical protein